MASPRSRGIKDLPPPPDYTLLRNPQTTKDLLHHLHSFKPSNRPKKQGRGEFRPQVFTIE